MRGFNPRSRGGSDNQRHRCPRASLSFNPRSRGGSDCNLLMSRSLLLSFNPRSRGGSDLTFATEQAAINLVSIHAPAGGATTKSRYGGTKAGCFNPRSRGGSDS